MIKKITAFGAGLAVGGIVGYICTKKKIERECNERTEEELSSMRQYFLGIINEFEQGYEQLPADQKNDEVMEKIEKGKERLIRSEERYSSENVIKKYKSLEEEAAEKEEIMAKVKNVKIISEEEFDELKKDRKYGHLVIEHHWPGNNFTLEDGSPFTVFDALGIADEVSAASVEADYNVGTFVCDYTGKALYEVVRVDLVDEPEDIKGVYEKSEKDEIKEVLPEDPKIISEEEFAETNFEFDKVDIIFEDGEFRKLDDDEVIDNPRLIFGFDDMMDADELYVRNYDLETDYYIRRG